MCEVLIVVSDLESIRYPPLSLKSMCLYSQRQGISRPQIKGPLLHRFRARQLSPSQAKQQRNNFRKVFTEVSSCCYIQSSVVCSITSCCFFLSLSLCLAVALSVYLSLSHSPLRLLWGVKKEPTGDLCSIMQVCSCAVCCRLFAPHIAFLPIETHTYAQSLTHAHNHAYAEGIELWLPLCILCQV